MVCVALGSNAHCLQVLHVQSLPHAGWMIMSQHLPAPALKALTGLVLGMSLGLKRSGPSGWQWATAVHPAALAPILEILETKRMPLARLHSGEAKGLLRAGKGVAGVCKSPAQPGRRQCVSGGLLLQLHQHA